MADTGTVRRLSPRPLFVGRSDFGRWWEISAFGRPILKLPWPDGRNVAWRYLYRRSPWREWPPVEFTATRSGWALYVFNFVWMFRANG
jgi:hypothetical protein